jgi:hypothetical protein
VGLTRIELVTSSLSGMRSNQLSYSPHLFKSYWSTSQQPTQVLSIDYSLNPIIFA